MHRPSLALNGLRRLASGRRRTYVTDADIASARSYCLKQLDYDATLIHRFVPPTVRDAYAALRSLNLELVRLPELVSKPIIGAMRVKFWQESIDATLAGRPPREPICVLLYEALREMEQRTGSTATKQSIKFWISRLLKTRQNHMENRPFPTLETLEDYAENTYSTMMYATLAFMPLRSTHLDHLASHTGKASGIVAVLRGIPFLASPAQPVKTPSGAEAPSTREPCILLPLDVMAEAGVKEEDVFRRGPHAPGLEDAVFKVATRAHGHLLTAKSMFARLKQGQDAGHEFEHGGEADHVHGDDGDGDVQAGLRQSFGIFLEAVPAGLHLESLERANFNPYSVRNGRWKLPWRMWRALIVKTIGAVILNKGGVIRGISNWGVFTLPKPISANQMRYAHGHHFVIRYDSSVKVHEEVREILRTEPRMLRSAHVKLGDNKLETLAKFGPPNWMSGPGQL
ncbi:hypothetical protein L249_2469 [Ophiocordyceps polyrhachis-furcata BCC 54312]|uniref:Phytoene synthase n=1 Tax=Ophiocordyceps polyrhachis-furcata BCC 54312 TaxID=1330021 RepID=A0A367LSA9_9HYPO|nr:hypothetical protein L249_2469 [Ophiocordyceps polyrhachis-furcata BCC 54312]